MDFDRLRGQRRSDLEAILDIGEKKKLSYKIKILIVYECIMLSIATLLSIIIIIKNQVDEPLA